MAIEVTNENYFSLECNMAYMGHSQYLAFERCEAAALAELQSGQEAPWSTAFLVGGYVDAVFSDELPQFADQHPEMFKRDGSLKAEFLRANEIIARMESDELYMMLMSGRHQVVKTGEIAGVPVKIKIDSLLDAKQAQAIADKFPEARTAMGMCDGAIVDQKVLADTSHVWNADEHEYQSFVEAWGYDVEAAFYQAVEGNMLPFILAIGTKENSPGLHAVYIPDNDIAEKLAEIQEHIVRYQAIKEGKIKPKACGNCPYCRAHQKLQSIISYRDMEI